MRLSELYKSVQGEGPRVGLPTVFVRFGGCNLKCPAWPCDSPYAIDPKEYRKEWRTVTPEQVFAEIFNITDRPQNVCITGGEPWLQKHDELEELVGLLLTSDYSVEFFSNGTIMLPDWAFESGIQYVFDRKLAGSGEDISKIYSEDYLNGGAFATNIHRGFDVGAAALKFTIASDDDFNEALNVFDRLCDDYTSPYGFKDQIPVYVGAVWDKVSEAQVAEWLQEIKHRNWRLNVQVHKYIYDPNARGI